MSETLARRHERELAELLPHGSRIPMSGAGPERRDVVTAAMPEWVWRFLVEAKCTSKKGLRITAELWKEIREDVAKRSPDMRPALAVRFYEPVERPARLVPIVADLVAVDLHDFVEMITELVDLRERFGTAQATGKAAH